MAREARVVTATLDTHSLTSDSLCWGRRLGQAGSWAVHGGEGED